MRTPIINKPFIKKFATVNKSTKIKRIAVIHQNRITSTLCRLYSVCEVVCPSVVR